MLVTMKKLLDAAHLGNYAVAAPSVATELDARAVLDAAVELKSPLILNVSPTANVDIRFFGSYLTRLAESYPIEVAINLDHGKTIEDIVLAIQAGFTSVMMDCSSLSFEDNVSQVKEVVKFAHSVGISVEAELGHVGMGDSYLKDRNAGLTNPSDAKRYIEETGIDMLAIAIGTAHGEYVGKPEIDIERLKEIKKITNFPLVLHGGSGTGDDILHEVCTLGINKVNINTDLAKAAYQQLVEDGLGKNKIWYTIQLAYRNKLKHLVELFGCGGKSNINDTKNYQRKDIDMTEK